MHSSIIMNWAFVVYLQVRIGWNESVLLIDQDGSNPSCQIVHMFQSTAYLR